MKIAFIFPGYGSQFVGMGKELYDEYRIVQEYFEEASSCLNQNMVKLCFASSDAELARMNNAYPALFLVSSSIFAVLEQEGILPTLVAGFNQGEYAALFAAKGMTLPDGLYLLNKYATFYQEMLDVEPVFAAVKVKGLNAEQLEDICLKATAFVQQQASIALFLGFDEHIVTGTDAGIEHIRQLAGIYDSVSIDTIPVEIGLHSSLMIPVVEQLRLYLEKVDFKDLRFEMLEQVNGYAISKADEVRNHIVRAIENPIMWNRIMAALQDFDMIIEVGPGSAITDSLKRMYPEKAIIAINKLSDISDLKKIVQDQTKVTETTTQEDTQNTDIGNDNGI